MLSKLSRPISTSSFTYVCLACRAKHPNRPPGPRNLSTESSSESSISSLPPLTYTTGQSNATSGPGTITVEDETPSSSKAKKKLKEKDKTAENAEAQPVEKSPQFEQRIKDGKPGRNRGRTKGPVAQLKSFCKKHEIPLPQYDTTKNKDGQFRAQVTVRDRTIKLDSYFPTMVAAMAAVSPKALVYLESCSEKEVEKVAKQKTTAKKSTKTLRKANAETVPVSEPDSASTKRSVVRKLESKPSDKYLELEEQRQKRITRKAKVDAAIDRHLRRIRRERMEKTAKTHLVGAATSRRSIRKYGVLKIRRRLVDSPIIRKMGAPPTIRLGRRTPLREKVDSAQLTLKEALLGRRTTSPAHAGPGIEDNDEELDESTESWERNSKTRKNTSIYKPLGFQNTENIESVDVTSIIARGKPTLPC
jgi:hypothetical protein